MQLHAIKARGKRKYKAITVSKHSPMQYERAWRAAQQRQAA
jgi:hypothetical protein